ncbi:MULTISPECIES: 3-hydroxyacyl-CoA dehydrogenase NAD-binding domain-containing protein [Achromobacter]|uniref:3-hydroxyacyl-CoA dehydrogenase NAD-binding domain-containing protein n=1 Tax=Achromobacter spanius TaxID=217203 RepID=A0ABY8GYJ2_9BURK|nr:MULTISPECIES: 3-hydroxyacyl-CoA dehydrogenase NAD-binding domain-containing protein [Achromobacter]WAI80906.1 3-hydroxyacyl-CoA dehydrogenase NAD-binding domain-containing protein [Achromobacter spanius]WEX96420.1 3-hydroxyacyl-CoA dehydrogenase NAD-binding domain-containing protein [Achromobacter sp. SS2-2022]WFP09861.1 3-hydroxyacyl-CoA dehydrogenase NAD-binding domain-containing protein [Achromobacter spanius]
MLIHTERTESGQVAVLRLRNPPVNSLSAALRAELHAAIQAALADEGVRALVLAGDGGFFCCGAEIREFNTPMSTREPTLRTVIALIEGAAKPVVAAIHGAALGGGLELALGCHYRVALDGASLGLPEVTLGVLPGAGGTQRLPRIVGVERALTMIAQGDAIDTARALDWGLLDEVFADDLPQRAAAYALAHADGPLAGRNVGARKVAAPADPGIYDRAREQAARRYRGCVAPLACVACVETAANTTLQDGLAFERERFLELVNGSQSKAQRHLFFAERAAVKLPEGWKAQSPIATVGVVGAGTMGGGIAMSLANAGLAVVLVERDAQALERGWAAIRKNYAATAAKGKLTAAQVEAREARIRTSLDVADLRDADLVIEAAFEDMDVKRQIFTALDAVCKPQAILASNTSRLDIDEIAGFTRRPAQVLGMHFFSPANVMRLLEVVQGRETDGNVIAAVFRLARQMGKLPVLVGVCDGFVGNRMVSPYTREAHFLLEEGASPAQVDGALQRFGLAMGPLRMADMAGLDISWAFRKRMAPTRPAHLRYSRVADSLCEQGRFGQKTGSGFYRYEAGSREPLEDPQVLALIEQCARQDGIARRDITDEEIVQRTMYALVNEGARILEEGIARRASDIDVIYVNGYGFPAYRGGPLFYADEQGLPAVLATIRRFHEAHGELWQPAPLLERLVAEGKRFADL